MSHLSPAAVARTLKFRSGYYGAVNTAAVGFTVNLFHWGQTAQAIISDKPEVYPVVIWPVGLRPR